MADQANPQFGGQGIPFPGQGMGMAPVPPVQPIPMPGMPAPAYIPVQPVVPSVPVTPVAPITAPFSVPSPIAAPAPMPAAPFTAGAPAAPVAPVTPVTPAAIPSAPAPVEPKKPMTLEDLAKQTPIFSDEELEEDDFDPWAPLDDSTEIKPPTVAPVAPPVTPMSAPKVQPSVPKAEPELPKKPEVKQVEKEEEESEVIEGDLLSEEDIDPFEGIEDEEGENPLKQFFANANINGKKIAGCIVGFFLILALIVGLFYGGKALFGFLTKERPAKEVTEKVEEKDRPVVEEAVPGESQDLPVGWIEPSIYTGIKVGMEAAEGESSAAPEIPGVDISPSNENIIAYVNVLSRIRVLYETDIQAMLNRSTDRNRALNDFISSMKSVASDARKSLGEIAQRKLTLQSEFDSITAAKQLQEEQYFANLSANNPSETSQSLANFTELARQSVDIRARYRALHKIEEYMNRYAAAVETRIRDTEFNREALIKGVKVIDVEGSDIDLIIPESDL